MGEGTSLTGAINADNTGGTVAVTMVEGATWTLTEDSYISSIEGDISGIITNGYHLYVDGEELLTTRESG